MPEKDDRTIAEKIADNELITDAIRQGVCEELLSHARAGRSVPSYENGQLVWLSPEEIHHRLGCLPPARDKAS